LVTGFDEWDYNYYLDLYTNVVPALHDLAPHAPDPPTMLIISQC